MSDGRPVPGLNLMDSLPTRRSGVSSALSGYSEDTARMGELAKVSFSCVPSCGVIEMPQVKNELEEALKQVRMEMREGGATKSQMGSTARSQSVFSERSASVCSTVVDDWDLPAQQDKKLSTHRGLAK